MMKAVPCRPLRDPQLGEGAARLETVFGNRTTPVLTEHLLVTTEDGQPLVVTRKRAPGRDGLVPVVLVHGLGQNRFAWHLSSASLACGLVEAGFDVFIAELRGHGLSGEAGSRPPAGFREYVFRDVPAVLRCAREASGERRPFLIGHSLGGVIACALDPEDEKLVAGIIPIAAPIAFGRGMGFLRGFSFLALSTYDAIYRGRPQPERRALVFPLRPFRHMFRTALAEQAWFPFAVWQPGSLAPDVRQELLSRAFDRTGWEIIKIVVLWAGSGRFTNAERAEVYERNLAARRAPMLFICGDQDRLAPPAAVRPGFELAGSPDKTWRCFGPPQDAHSFGHYDLLLGTAAPEVVWPEIVAWMRARAE